MQTSNTRFIHQAQFAESRRVVARVRTIEQRIAHDRIDESCRYRLVDLREDIGVERDIGTDLQTEPHRTCILADGHVILVRDLCVQHQLIEHDLRTFMRFTITRGDERLQDIGRQDACQSRDGDEQRIGNGI